MDNNELIIKFLELNNIGYSLEFREIKEGYNYYNFSLKYNKAKSLVKECKFIFISSIQDSAINKAPEIFNILLQLKSLDIEYYPIPEVLEKVKNKVVELENL